MEYAFTTKDSGERLDYPSGMRRDIQTGKPDYLLLDRPMLKRWADLMVRGAEKYGRRNWEKANSEDELERFKGSAFRHLIQWLDGERDEDHAAAVFFNIAAAEYVKRKIADTAPKPNRENVRCVGCGITMGAVFAPECKGCKEGKKPIQFDKDALTDHWISDGRL